MFTLRSFVMGALAISALLLTPSARAASTPSETNVASVPCAVEVDVADLLAVDNASEARQCVAPTAPVSLDGVVTRQRTCRCSCGFPCQTSADCGGAACTVGISCC